MEGSPLAAPTFSSYRRFNLLNVCVELHRNFWCKSPASIIDFFLGTSLSRLSSQPEINKRLKRGADLKKLQLFAFNNVRGIIMSRWQ